FTLHGMPRDTPRKIRGRVDRYSFLVRIFHPLLPAGLSRRFPDVKPNVGAVGKPIRPSVSKHHAART
ncbi:MAG: hypothetical protein WAO35_21415, partial [Terriglobia bacterium]